MTTITDSNGRVTKSGYDASYSVTNSVDAEVKTTYTEYFKDVNPASPSAEKTNIYITNQRKLQIEMVILQDM